MGLADAARARLLGALRPWLAADPGELRVELGPLRCRAVARGLELGAAALAAPDSFPAKLDRAAVAEVELTASPWAAPALAAVLRGVDVSLTLREPAPRRQRSDIKEWVSNEKKRVIASMDPQGEMLHEMIEGLVRSLEDKVTPVFSSALLNCSQLTFTDRANRAASAASSDHHEDQTIDDGGSLCGRPSPVSRTSGAPPTLRHALPHRYLVPVGSLTSAPRPGGQSAAHLRQGGREAAGVGEGAPPAAGLYHELDLERERIGAAREAGGPHRWAVGCIG